MPMFKSFKNYIAENPNVFQIVSTLVIGIVAYRNLEIRIQSATVKVNSYKGETCLGHAFAPFCTSCLYRQRAELPISRAVKPAPCDWLRAFSGLPGDNA